MLVLVAFGVMAAVGAGRPTLAPERLKAVILIDPLSTYVTDAPYASGTPMGILAPGILKVGDIPHMAGLVSPRRLVIAGGVSPQGRKLNQKELEEAFRFTADVYKAVKAADKLTITTEPKGTPSTSEHGCQFLIFVTRLPLEMQWLESKQVIETAAFDAFHFGKAANSRACGRGPLSDLHHFPRRTVQNSSG